jgi:hypothetical protein
VPPPAIGHVALRRAFLHDRDPVPNKVIVMSAVLETVALLESLAPGGRKVVIREPLVEDECRWFLEAVKSGLVRFRACDAACFRFRKWGVPGDDHFDTPSGKPRHLFSSPLADPAWLNREYVPHIAAYGRAVLDAGYPAEASSFSLYRTYGRDLVTKRVGRGYETDAEFYDSDGSILLQIEAKARPGQVASLVRQLDAAQTLAALPPGSLKELEYVLDLAPRFLWVVGPGSVDPAPYVYAVEAHGLDARFRRVGSVPPRFQVIENPAMEGDARDQEG